MAAHPKRFSESVIAEMRGVMSDSGECPFWEAIGRHFFQMDFPQADSLSTINKRFIEDLMPRHPIYTNLLPESARSILGQVHPQTVPALTMLREEGFQIDDLIDIFDGGPVVRCLRDQIGAVKRTKVARVKQIVPQLEGEPLILASSSGGFRSMIGAAQHSDDGAIISEVVALTLHLKVGDNLRSLTLHA